MWRHLPSKARESVPMRAYGAWLHRLVRRHSHREMYLGTFFLRNRPALELLRRLADRKYNGSTLRIAVLGCSIGVEVYSILWVLRSARPDLQILVHAVDTSPEVLEVGRAGLYGPAASAMVGSPIFERLGESELRDMFDWEGDAARVKPWLREGVEWHLDDACDSELRERLGRQDIVVASNFLCHMDDSSAEKCLRSMVRLVESGGFMLASGVDVNVRASVARDLGWEPIGELIQEIHDGDPVIRDDWPWRWWGLEPFDRTRPDWQTRYAAAFQVGVAAE